MAVFLWHKICRMCHTAEREKSLLWVGITLGVILGAYMSVLMPVRGPAVQSKGLLSINSLSPAGATVGDAGFTLIVNGANFGAGTTVFFNFNPRRTTVLNSSQLLVSILDSDLAQAGSFSVMVSNATPRKTVSAQFVVSPVSTDTALTSSLDPSSAGDAVTFVASVMAPAGTPTGAVVFMDGLNPVWTNLLSGGLATFTTSLLSTGTHWMCAIYCGDGNCLASTNSPAVPQVVGQPSPEIATTTILGSSTNPGVFGQSVVFIAKVTSSVAGAGPPGGTVTFEGEGVSLGTRILDCTGQTAFLTESLPTGTNLITAVYHGDGFFLSSSSMVLTQMITKASSATFLDSSADPCVCGQWVTITATVVPVAPGSGTPMGLVVFNDSTNLLGTGTLSSGQATLTLCSLKVGAHSVSAAYSGDSNFGTNTAPALGQTVNQSGSTISLVSSANPSVRGQAVTFTAQVSAVAPGSGTPTGTVTFMDGNKSLVTVVLVGGQATYTTTTLNPSPHSITAVYNGDSSFYGSTSGIVNEVVN
ncbi:MAG: vegetative cell wall protein [Verrucomicrobia bacterium]|nr:MAG: vegetative cell wall protein [Verrucomicrobiota bacterium]